MDSLEICCGSKCGRSVESLLQNSDEVAKTALKK